MPKFDEGVESQLAQIVVDTEYRTAETNQAPLMDDYRSYLDLFDAERSEKDYDWMSDISLPEFATHMLTQSAMDVDQYFSTRDFVECYIQDSKPEAKLAAEASKECINRTLNRRNLHHYHKYVRAKNINHLKGEVWLKCWWEFETRDIVVSGVDPDTGEPFKELVKDGKIVKDQFNYEVLDPRNVFTDNRYTYSIQEKKWIIIRSEKTLEDLKASQKQFGYFPEALKDLEEISSPGDTETKTEVTDDQLNQDFTTPKNKIDEYFDILERHGVFWVVDNKDGTIAPGLDESSEVKDGARLAQVVITFATNGNTKKLIGFHETPYTDAEGNPFMPLVRGLCYIHPAADGGVGDGKYARELQIAINDTFNLNNDRTLLATMPTLRVKSYLNENTDSIYFAPGHIMEMENDGDITEFQIADNINGGLQQMGILTEKMQQATSIYPSAMGGMPTRTSTPATTVSIAEQHSNTRSNYKSMTFEYTALNDLYWMILQMTHKFARKNTLVKLMGDKVFNFDPSLDYYYKPLSQSIESDQSKQAKIQRWTQILQIASQTQHPNMVGVFNYILLEIAKLMGDEHDNIPGLSPEQPIQSGSGSATGEQQIGAPSNQNGIPQSMPEMATRGDMNG